MPILDHLTKRRSYRAYSNRIVDKEVLILLAQAASLAPSSANNQPWRIISVTDFSTLERLRATLSRGNYWAKHAPVLTAFISNTNWSLKIKEREYAFFELGMAAMAYQMQAIKENLIVHPMAGYNEQEAKEVLNIPKEAVLLTLMSVGYRGDSSYLSEKHLKAETAPQIRKPLEKVFAFDSWNSDLDLDLQQ